MKTSNFIEILKSGSFVVQNYLLKVRNKFDCTIEEYLFLIYLTNKGEKIVFDPVKISEDLYIEPKQVLEYISNLSNKSLISVDVIKNERNVREEYISLELFYKKLSNYLVEDINGIDEKTTINIYETIEKEFGRTLSPMEYEIIKAWLESGTTEELIELAVKEAVFNGVNNLRYIDKIIFEWKKKGFKNKTDVEKHQTKYREEKEKKAPTEYYEYDWLDEENE